MKTEHYLKIFRKRVLLLLVDREGAALRSFSRVPKEHFAFLAGAVGLTPALLQEAIDLARVAALNEEVLEVGSFCVTLPAHLRPYVATVAKQNGFHTSVRSYMRSLFHAVMQTEHEPKRRHVRRLGTPEVSIEPIAGSRRVKPTAGARAPAGDYEKFKVSLGLRGAIRARAERYGLPSSLYCEQWVLDAIDGLLPKTLLVEPVKLGDLFPQAENYILPAPKVALTPEPESDTIERNSP